MSRSSPLDLAQIAQPCQRPWEEMTGDDRKRFCTACNKTVHNLSAMPRDEAERLLCESAGSLCVRYQVGSGGLPVTLEYQKRARVRGGWKVWAAVGAIGACATGAVQALVRPRPSPPPPPPPLQQFLVGEIRFPLPMEDSESETPPPPPGVPLANTSMSLERQ
jgi:hypothetical protein